MGLHQIVKIYVLPCHLQMTYLSVVAALLWFKLGPRKQGLSPHKRSGTTEDLEKLDKDTFLSVFEGVPTYEIDRGKLDAGIAIVELLATETAVFPSKGDLRRTIKGNGLSLNKRKLSDQESII